MDKKVVITGATGGLGEEIAYQCAKNGAHLFLLARNKEKLERIAKNIRDTYQVECVTFSVDLSQLEQIPAVFQKIIRDAGQIDVLVNNAGYGVFAEARDVCMEDVEGMFAVNVLGLIACTKEVIPSMCNNQAGHIINIASQAGKLATPKSSVYAATKHAVIGYTDSLRMEMSRFGVYVTAVNPGPIRTNFFQQADPSGTYLQNVERILLDPKKVAYKIVQSMFTNKREINLPWWMNVVAHLHELVPSVVERLGRKAFFKK